MIKSQVYSWRLTPELKAAAEEQARRRGESLGALLDQVVGEWLGRQGTSDEAAEQARIRAAAMRAIGQWAGTEPMRSTRVRELVRARVLAKRRHEP